MSFRKIAVGLVAAMVGAAAVTALAGTVPDAKPGLAAPAAPAGQVEALPPVSACPQAPWPYGCQWQEPVRRVQRSTRSF
jgi:hypothetical protein